jgi:hypothetical protein
MVLEITVSIPSEIKFAPRRYVLNNKTYTKETELSTEDIINKLYKKLIDWEHDDTKSSITVKNSSIIFQFNADDDDEKKRRFLSLYAQFNKSNIKIIKIKIK